MNRRRDPRQPISLSALVHPATGRTWLCTVRDFCRKGMLLTGAGAARSLAAGGTHFSRGDGVAVHFSVPTPSGTQHYRTKASVARVLESGNGIGVVFEGGLPDGAVNALIEFAVASGMLSQAAAATVLGSHSNGDPRSGARAASDPDAVPEAMRNGAASARCGDRQPVQSEIPDKLLRDRRITDAQAARARRKLRRLMEQVLERLSARFLEKAAQELLLSARDAGTNAVQMMFFEGLDLIEKQGESMMADMSAEVLRQVDEVSDIEEVLQRRHRRERGDSAKLEVVDTEEFEDWLAVVEIIAKAESRYADQLMDMRAQLGLIARPWTHKDALPVGPAVIAWAFDDVIQKLDMRRQIRQDLYRYFEEALLPMLGKSYEALGKVFAESEFFPSVEEIKESLARAAVRRSPTGVRVEPEAYENMDSAVREAAMAADGISASARVASNPFAPSVARGGQVYAAARNILNLSRRTSAVQGKRADDMLAAPDAGADETFKRNDILEALARIESEFGDATLSDQRLKLRLMEVLRERHGESKGLTEEDYDTLDVMESLVDSIESDSFLTPGVREWIRRLEVTLNKLAAKDPGFLRSDPDQPHSAMLMLNQLARLGNAKDVNEGIDREVGRRVDELLQRVIREFDRNPEVFSEVVDALNPLVDRQVQAYRGNIERTVRASEGQQKLARARRAVVEALAERFQRKAVPDLVLELLNPGWRNLLVHTHLRRGPESHEWMDQLALLDQLWGQLAEDITPQSPGYIEPDSLLKRIVDCLTSISFDPARRTPLIMALSAALVGDTAGERAPVRLTRISVDQVTGVLGLDGLLPEANPRIDAQDDQVRQSFDKAVQRARRIQVGEWLATAEASGRPLILTVAFVGDDASGFVLVNRKGVKARELSLQAMSEGLHEGKITLLDDYELPLMERASQRMLENMHNELAYRASHDDLTELLNRKEFERQVHDAIQAARATERQHALLYLDLDQFKIVNSTSGHTAGDELLKLIAGTLTAALADVPAQVGRLGGDEFGMLVEDVSSADARKLAEDVLDAIRAQRFEWDGREYALSASMGLVFIDRSTENVDAVMQNADEACYAAKDSGRNRVQEYELGDSVIRNRHGIMEWVTQLDKALNTDRLVLNCQRISPVAASGSTACSYEILLTMMDEMGDPMPPGEFILAAETYQRMSIIDRWVVERVFQWMADHRSQLDRFGGFSVNVSGHSVNDETFPDFVLEQFSRTQAPTGKVCFEITETAAIANLENARDFMSRMKIIGCRFALDDFGTGLSSYSYLRNLPVDYVKIDGIFVKDIVNNPGDYAVVRSINEIGHYMGKQTIAEYVESESVLECVRDIGVDFVQGYHVAKPCRLEDLRI